VTPSAKYKRDTKILHYKSPTFVTFISVVHIPHCFGMLSMPITSAVGWGTALHVGRSRLRFTMM